MAELASWSFGDWLQRRRQALHLTQRQLADRAGYSVATIRKLEGDQRRPSVGVARVLARALQIPEEEHAPFLRFARGEGQEPALDAPGAMTGSHPLLPPSNLPLAPSRLFGRAAEIQAVRALLEQDDVRLLTLSGPGGVGKTRLALAVADALDRVSFDGVYFIALESIDEPSLVLPVIARRLEVREHSDRPLALTLGSYLRDRRLLLVLDNFEQLVVAGPQLVELLECAPCLKLLVTSRMPLRLRAEREVRVAPLATPDRLDQDPQVLARYDAVQLFLQRAQASQADPSGLTTSTQVVASICAKLDGLPLAIELAAARSRVLPPEALLRRLDAPLALLTTGSGDLPPRQQTLRSTIAWSTNLLPPDAQTLFRRLAVFAGGWTLDAAEQVCIQEPHASSAALDRLQTLVEASLVQAAEAGGEARFTMLATIREYALEQLDVWGEGERMRQAHALYYLALAETAEPRNQGPGHALSLVSLETEHANLRAALNWCQE